MIKCSICEKEYKDSGNFKQHLTKQHLQIQFNNNKIILEEFCLKEIYNIDVEKIKIFINDYKNKKMSIRFFSKENNIPYSSIANYLKVNDIKIFSSKEMCGLDFVIKNKENTFLERYDIKNNFGNKSIHIKALKNIDHKQSQMNLEKSLIQKYGVSNVSQIPGVGDKISKKQKYNCSIMSYEEKLKRTEKAREAIKYVSKLEIRIQEVLNDMQVSYTKNGFLYK